MNFLKKHKNPILFLVIAVLIIVAYLFFFSSDGGNENNESLTSQDVGNELQKTSEIDDSSAGAEILSLLLKMRSIELKKDVFEKESFKSLEDFSREISSQPIGRQNPFYPIDEIDEGNQEE